MILWLSKTEALQFVEQNRSVIDAAGNPANPFCSSVWFEHFITEVVGDEGRVAVIESDTSGRSVMLLSRDEGAGVRVRSLANYYSSLFTPLLSSAGDRAGAAKDLVRRLSGARPRIATLSLSPLASDCDDTEQLASGLSVSGWFLRRYSCFGNWTLPCDGMTHAQYMAARDSQLRNTYARKAKKLLAAGSLDICTRPEDVDLAMDAFNTVYAKSWKQPEPYPNFVRGWARRCASQGWLRLGTARVDGVVVAAQFWFTIARRAYIFKLAYDEDYAKWSAGTVLTAHMFEHALDVDKVVEIDYLTGDDAYKRSWMSHRRERVGLMACNLATVAGMAAASREWAGAATSNLRARLRASAVT